MWQSSMLFSANFRKKNQQIMRYSAEFIPYAEDFPYSLKFCTVDADFMSA